MTKCSNCGFQVDLGQFKRCPRCNSIVDIPKKCGDCKGCSLYPKEKCK